MRESASGRAGAVGNRHPLRPPSAVCALAVFAALILYMDLPALVGPDRLYLADITCKETPRDRFLGAALREGDGIPRWIPGVYGGIPALGTQDFALLYPPNVVAALASPERARAAILALDVALAAAGAWQLARRLGASGLAAIASGLAYGFGGPFLSIHFMAPAHGAGTWLPWTIVGAIDLAAGRGGFLVAAGSFLLGYLSGDPQGPIVGFFAGATCVLCVHGPTRAAGAGIARFALAGAVALLLAGAQVLPALAVWDEGARRDGIAWEEASRWSLWPPELLELAVPFLFGEHADATGNARSIWMNAAYPGHEQLFYETTYLSVVTLACAAAGATSLRRSAVARSGLALGAAFLPFALGRFSPVYAFASEIGAHYFRYPAKLFLPVALGLSLLAARGLDLLGARSREASRGPAVARVVLGVVAGLSLGVALLELLAGDLLRGAFRALGDPIFPEEAASGLAAHALRGGATAAAALIVIASRGRRRRVAALLGLAVIDLGIGIRREVMLAPAWAVDQPPLVAGVLERLGAEDGAPARVIGTMPAREITDAEATLDLPHQVRVTIAQREGLEPNSALGSVLQQNGFVSLPKVRAIIAGNLPVPTERQALLMGARFVYANVREVARGSVGMTPVAYLGQRVLLRIDEAPPWAAVYERAIPVSDVASAAAGVLAPDFDPRTSVYVEGAGPLAVTGGASVHPARLVGRLGPHRLELDLDGGPPGWLVLREAYGRGWRAWVDSVEAPVLPADVLFRAIPVPGGARHVVLRYEAPRLAEGMALSFGTLAALGLALVRSRGLGRRL